MKLSTKQQQFYDAVMSGSNIFLTGKAGTGKSFIVRKVIEDLNKSGKKVVALAPTGIAANNIGGQTIHSMFNLTPFGVLTYDDCSFLKGEKRRMIEKINVIIIDEISMLRPDILDAINWTMLKNGCGSLSSKQLVFVGDLKQLPPPIDDNTRSVLYRDYDGEEFFHAAIYGKLAPETIELDEVLRQSDDEFIHHLNIIREGGKSEYFRQFAITMHDQKGIVLAPHNTTVQRYNENGLSAQPGELHVFDAVVSGNVKADDFGLETKVRVKDGCKVMYLVNSKNNPLVNGTLGIFVAKDDKYFIRVNETEFALDMVTFTKKEYVYNRHEDKLELQEIGSITQFPIKLAYALSIHKAQGMTFDEVSIDMTRPCFAKGQLYVALSRVKTPQGLRIITN